MTAELLAAYDANTGEGGYPSTQSWLDDFLPWMREHGVEPNDTDRVEIYLLDAPFMRVYQPAQNEKGWPYLDDDLKLARRPPFDVLIKRPAPRPEDYR